MQSGLSPGWPRGGAEGGVSVHTCSIWCLIGDALSLNSLSGAFVRLQRTRIRLIRETCGCGQTGQTHAHSPPPIISNLATQGGNTRSFIVQISSLGV